MNDYKGIFVWDRVTIVTRPPLRETIAAANIPQGYPIETGNSNTLKSANKWAVEYNTQKEKDVLSYDYENGKFSLALFLSAENSTQGGDLSFWNCLITGPDGRKFIIGINSESLLNLMCSTTFKNGECQDHSLYISKDKGRTGICSKNSKVFQDYISDKKIRNEKTDTSYLPGEFISTLKEKQVYIGPIYFRFRFNTDFIYGSFLNEEYNSLSDIAIVAELFNILNIDICTPVIKRYLFASVYNKTDSISDYYTSINIKSNCGLCIHNDYDAKYFGSDAKKTLPPRIHSNLKINKDLFKQLISIDYIFKSISYGNPKTDNYEIIKNIYMIILSHAISFNPKTKTITKDEIITMRQEIFILLNKRR